MSFPPSTEGYTPVLPAQRQILKTFMEFPSYRVVVVPYEAHECLRSHRGVDLTGKLRVSAFAYVQHGAEGQRCQERLRKNRVRVPAMNGRLSIVLFPRKI